jgi:3-hydroxyisobutyrate dehydrogenase-like beta-hydroxyacid dehydrogenase
MGRAVATCLIRAGRSLAVYDVRAETTDALPPGTIVAAAPSEVSAACDVVLIVVVDEAQVRAVLWGPGGLMESARESLSVVVLSTIGVQALLDIAERARRSGVTLLDCGVTGGDVAATRGVVSMVGGNAGAVRRIRPVLDDFSSRVFHMGPLGAGMSTKLVRNVISYCSWHVVYEAGMLAERCGVDFAMLSDVLESSYQGSGGLTVPLRRGTVAPMDPSDPHFDAAQYQRSTAAVSLLHKDLKAAQDLAEARDVDLSVAAPTRADAALIFGLPALAAKVNGNGTTNTHKEAEPWET